MAKKALCMAILLMGLLVSMTACSLSDGKEKVSKEEAVTFDGTIVALGDSLTAGYGVKEKETYPYRLERRLNDSGWHCRVVNAGISGEKSAETLARVNQVLSLNPSLVILEIGVNDGFMGLEPRLIERNIGEIVNTLRQHKVTVILAGMRMFDNDRPAYNNNFAAIYPRVASQAGVILIPHFLEGVAGDPALNRLDGIHPTPKGYRIVADTVLPYVLQALKSDKQR